MTLEITHRVTRKARRSLDPILYKVSPIHRDRRKYALELRYWKSELEHLRRWYVEGSADWGGSPPPPAEARWTGSDLWAVNAVMTLHKVRPHYFEELKLGVDSLRDKKVLEVGCGPLAPILQFAGCTPYGLDPLLEEYVQAGWPLHEYGVELVGARAESMPCGDAHFDAVISVNALDHVDNFRKVASEIQRVVKIGGRLYFSVEYHSGTLCEPQKLTDNVIVEAFSRCKMDKVMERGKRDAFQDVVKRFGLIPGAFDHLSNEVRLVTWHGERVR